MTPTAALALAPDTIEWDEVAPDGTRYALLAGDRADPDAPFAYAFFVSAGFWDPPHRHSRTAHVFVASGALHLGYGERHEPSALARHPAGSLVVVPAEAVHFDGSDEDTVIYGVAMGGWSTTYLDLEHRPSAGTPGG